MEFQFINNIKEFLSKKYKTIIFVLIFIAFSFLYNSNNQNLNYLLKRGTILEYSIKANDTINEDKIEDILVKQGVKYSYIKSDNIEYLKQYDKDNKKIEKILYIGLPIKINECKKEIFNNVSKYIFNSYDNSKLLNIKPLNDNYNKPYSSFIKFFHITLLTFFIWFIILYLVKDDKNFFKDTFMSSKNWLTKKKDDFITFIKNTKENGFTYFLKKVFLEEDEKEDSNITKEVLNTIIFVVVSVILIRFFIGELRWIPSGSMRPTILEKDRVFVEKLEYPTKEIKRGDILVFYPPEVQLKNDPISIFSRLSGILCKDIAFIKRVVGMPNDKFEIKLDKTSMEYRVFINDVALNEPYIITKTEWTPCNNKMYCGPFTIPENHYFMMGDNRGNSQDSRFWGFLNKDRVIGRANFMFWPIRRINVLTDKYIELYSQKKNNKLIKQKYIINRYELLYNI